MKTVVCFGLINPGIVFAVDVFPRANTGAYVSAKWPFIGADSVMVARTLARWASAEAHVIGNALGDDAAGRRVISDLTGEGVRPHIDLRPELRTPDEVDVVDAAGNRTFFVETSPIWDTAAEADLNPIASADLVYVDWYAYAGAQRVVDAARVAGVPVYLNVEYALANPAGKRDLIAGATWVQASLSADEDAPADHAEALARAMRALGPRWAIVTRGRNGALAFDGENMRSGPALSVQVLDGQGAGAAFSAAMIHALLHGWDLGRSLPFAVRAGSLKVAQRGLLETLPEG